MHQFISDLLVPVEKDSVLPGYSTASNLEAHLAFLGFNSHHTYSNYSGQITVDVYRVVFANPKEPVGPTLFIVNLNGHLLDEIFCADGASALKCLIMLSPMFSGLRSSLFDDSF